MLQAWNYVLVIMTFALTIFGTFLTRSGVIASVHAFALSSVGPLLLAFLGGLLALAIVSVPVANAQDDEVIELSPFQVDSQGDTGYEATSTLAGTRLKELSVCQ